mmetsp:Transcript_22160/g.27242  ORF Transcript_22160/g.27242 Transcript_22160/m.27242 type:complete len:82 (-) Transcript_22160:1236-1481(-)
MGANLVLTLLLSISLRAMWNLVHVLQVIVFLPKLLDYPPNAQLFVDSIEEAVELENFTQDVYEKTLPEDVLVFLEKDADQD